MSSFREACANHFKAMRAMVHEWLCQRMKVISVMGENDKCDGSQ